MSQPLTAHVEAMRRQIRRIQRTTFLATAAALACAAVLLPTPRAGWLSMVLLLLTLGYLRHLILQLYWARWARKQLRLEEQFVRHGPAPEELLLCVRRRNHMWTQSLTLKSLKTLLTPAPGSPLPVRNRRHHLRRHYQRCFSTLRPSHLPAGLIWFTVLLLLWIWSVPEALLYTLSPRIVLGAVLLLALLAAEIVQAVLRADLRDGFEALTGLLSDWTLARQFEETRQAAQEKHYRHSPLYHAALPPPAPRAPLSTEPHA